MKSFYASQQKLILIDVLEKESLSIAQLSRKIGMKRSTLIYYLNQLESEGLIKRERIEDGETGRPTIIKFQKEIYQQKREELNNKIKEDQQKIFDQLSNNPITIKILKLIKENPNLDFNELLNKPEIKDYVLKFKIISWLHRRGFVKESFDLTEQGKKFLKEYNK